MPTLEKLRALNASYHAEHHLSEQDLSVACFYAKAIQASRSDRYPQNGDILLTTNGKRASIEVVKDAWSKRGDLYICEGAYTPFIRVDACDSRITPTFSTSGGPWRHVSINDIKPEPEENDTSENERPKPKKAIKLFCFFGHGGAQANGAVDFETLVNVWRETTPKKYQRLNLHEIKGEPVSAQKYEDMLGVLPPERMTGNAFLVGEPTDHHGEKSRARYAFYYQLDKGYYYGGLMTAEKFDDLSD